MTVPVARLEATMNRDGFAIIPGVLALGQIDRLRPCAEVGAPLLRAGQAFGGRNLLADAGIRKLAMDEPISALIEAAAGTAMTPVRALFFDKTPGANWPVLWHQDLMIAVAQRHEKDGWGPWSLKAGVVHVEPPVALLETMVTIRLNLDDNDAANGPLRVLPGTHRLGRLKRERVAELRKEIGEVVCVAPLGSAILMRPLLLHASSPAEEPNHRRVIQIEYAPKDALPQPLRWAFAQEPAPPEEGALPPGIA